MLNTTVCNWMWAQNKAKLTDADIIIIKSFHQFKLTDNKLLLLTTFNLMLI